MLGRYPRRGKIPDSDKEALITGLNLLRLLVQNRIAEFHVELELLPDHISEAAFVKLPIELEQCLMEGAYTKVLGYTENAPDDHFRFFMDRLKDTVRYTLSFKKKHMLHIFWSLGFF